MTPRVLLVGTLALAALFTVAPAAAQAPEEELCERGPIRIRNQFPLSLHFLSFPGEDARLVGTKNWEVNVEVTTSNTFVGSRSLEQPPSPGRGTLTQEGFDALIAADPERDLYLFDGETARAWFLVRYGLTEWMDVAVEVPYVYLGGGYMDGLIEGFHRRFGFEQGGRDRYQRDELLIALHLDGQTSFVSDRGGTSGLAEPVISAKWRLVRERDRVPAVSLQAAVKFPLGGHRLMASGDLDAGLNLLLAKRWIRQSAYVNVGYVAAGDWSLMPGLPISNAATLLLAYERYLAQRASLVVQDLIHTSFMRDASREEIADSSHEVTIGIKWDGREHVVWTASLTENYATFNSSPDFGVHVGLACMF